MLQFLSSFLFKDSSLTPFNNSECLKYECVFDIRWFTSCSIVTFSWFNNDSYQMKEVTILPYPHPLPETLRNIELSREKCKGKNIRWKMLLLYSMSPILWLFLFLHIIHPLCLFPYLSDPFSNPITELCSCVLPQTVLIFDLLATRELYSIVVNEVRALH